MHNYGRVPMSFSHGDFSYEYLRQLAIDDNGKRRFERLYFAVHFDRFMVRPHPAGRRRRAQVPAGSRELLDP